MRFPEKNGNRKLWFESNLMGLVEVIWEGYYCIENVHTGNAPKVYLRIHEYRETVHLLQKKTIYKMLPEWNY